MVQEFGNFPRVARGAMQEYVCRACAVQFPAERQAGCSRYCFVIKVLKDHHSLRLMVLRFTP